MPYQHRTSPSPRRWRVLILASCLLIGISGFVFGIAAILSSSSVSYRCSNAEPESVRVVWERGGGGRIDNGIGDGDPKRHRVMGFVGIQTGFGSVGRRRSLRQTWMPSDRQGLKRLEEATGLAFRFIIGRTNDKWKMLALKKEVEEYDDFVLLDVEEEYSKLPYKTLAFFKAAYALFDSEFYVKADDDIYLRPDRLSLLLAKERTHSQTYIGCMKKGPVFTDPKLKWYEPLSYLLGMEYFLHAYGPIYALSADVVASLVALRNNSFRMFSNEDVTIGAWMLAMNVNLENNKALCEPECTQTSIVYCFLHLVQCYSFRMFSNEDVTIGAWMLAMNVNLENNKALCEPECTQTSIAVWDIPKCSGLCNPEKKLLELHQKESCSKSPTLASDD